MSISASSEESLEAGLASPGGGRSLRETLGLAGSVTLHGLALLLLVLAPPFGALGTHGAMQLVPIEIVAANEDKAAPARPPVKELPPGEASQPLPANPTTAADAAPLEKVPPPDALDTKLQALAKLRQPDTDRPPEPHSAATPQRLASSDDAAPGRLATLKDFIRVQVERHWSLDVASLGNGDYAVPIQIEITSGGVVLKAEILDAARASDPAYHDIAVSARNAVLLASPLALPPGEYKGVMELVLELNPRETVR